MPGSAASTGANRQLKEVPVEGLYSPYPARTAACPVAQVPRTQRRMLHVHLPSQFNVSLSSGSRTSAMDLWTSSIATAKVSIRLVAS